MIIVNSKVSVKKRLRPDLTETAASKVNFWLSLGVSVRNMLSTKF